MMICAPLRILDVKKDAIRLFAPTGRAARGLKEATGIEAMAIYRLFGNFNPDEGRFRRNRDNPLDCDLVVVDETSMVDTELMAQLLDAVPIDPRSCGSGYRQLPSVGPGACSPN